MNALDFFIIVIVVLILGIAFFTISKVISSGEAQREFCKNGVRVTTFNGRLFCDGKEFVCSIDTHDCIYIENLGAVK